ncbi:MAG: SGNH/GDSL hydrolase family protein, partial [Hyphomicrobiales bacterium]|nr:SGNH/GDSL hydrolase family protein [Hyphomicrobiales bacterium]
LGLARAAETPAPPPAGAPPTVGTKLSAACDVPANDIANSGSLRNLGAKLARGEPITILAIGSSSTSGIGASSRSRNYPSDLRGILGKALAKAKVTVINRGIAGEVASETADRMRTEVALDRPDLVLWQLGTNDAVAHVDPSDFETTVVDTVRWLHDNGIDVALIGLQYTSRFSRDASYVAIRDALWKVADREHVLYVRRYSAMRFIAKTRAKLKMMAPDNFHLNDLGYECMAEHVAKAVVGALFVKRFRPVAR